MKKCYIIAISLLCIPMMTFAIGDWSLFGYRQPSYYIYEQDGAKHIDQINHDYYTNIVGYSGEYFNYSYKDKGCPCCYDVICPSANVSRSWGSMANTYFGPVKSGVFGTTQGYTFEGAGGRVDFYKPIKGNEFWYIPTKDGKVYDNVSVKAMGKYYGKVLNGISDSLCAYKTEFFLKGKRVFPIQDSTPFLLSKNYGFIKFLRFSSIINQELIQYKIAGFEKKGIKIGWTPPRFDQYFNYKKGDILLSKNSYTEVYRRDSIANTFKNLDSVIYIVYRKELIKDTIIETPNVAIKYYKSNFEHLQSPTYWQVFIGSGGEYGNQYSSFGYDIKISGKDTIVSRSFVNEGKSYNQCYLSTEEIGMGGYFSYETFDTKHGNKGTTNASPGILVIGDSINNQTPKPVLVKENVVIGYKRDSILEGTINFPPPAVSGVKKSEKINRCKIYPNPFNNELKFNISGTGQSTVIVTNAQGIIIFENKYDQEECTIQLPPETRIGLYFVQIKKNGKTYHEKIVKE